MAIKIKPKFKPKTRRKVKQAVAAEQARKTIGEEAGDLGVPSDVIHKERVQGFRPEKAHAPSPARAAIISGVSEGQRRGWQRKLKRLDRLDDELTTNESKITALLKEGKTKKGKQLSDDAIEKKEIKIGNLQARNKEIKEMMALERKSMTEMREKQGPGIQVKKGGIVKRSKGGLLGMGAALRGGGAVRKRSY